MEPFMNKQRPVMILPLIALGICAVWLSLEVLDRLAGAFEPEKARRAALASALFTLALAWVISTWFTADATPWALARKPNSDDLGSLDSLRNSAGHAPGIQSTVQPIVTNNTVSLSKLQTLLFFLVAVSVYVLVYAVRVFGHNLPSPLPRIPIEVVVLIGLSAATTLGSQAISLQYQSEGRVSESDRSDVLRNRDGQADLTKMQMLLWTIVAVTVYLVSTANLMTKNCFALKTDSADSAIMTTLIKACGTTWSDVDPKNSKDLNELGPKLPSFDPLLLVLAGVVQGTYFGGRLLGTRNPPQIDGVYRQAGPPSVVRLVGNFTGLRTIETSQFTPKPFNFMLEITDVAGQKSFVNFLDSTTIKADKANDTFDSHVRAVEASSSLISLTNFVPPGSYSFRLGIDGVWSEAKTFALA
jgi:hypothetical protein